MKKKLLIFLPIACLAVLLIIGAVLFGLRAEEERIISNCMTLEEIEKLEDTLKELTEDEILALKEEAKTGVKDERTMRLLLLMEEEMQIKVSEQLNLIASMKVKGNKTLTGDATIKMYLGSNKNTMQDALLVVSNGSTLTIQGLVLDGNGVCNAINVEQKAILNYNEGTVMYGSPYGIHNLGTAHINGGTLTKCMAAGIGVETGSVTNVTGGDLKDNYKNHIWSAADAKVNVTGGVFDHSYSHAIHNIGILNMTGGTIKNSNSADACAVANFGEAYIDGGDNYIEVSNCVTGFFSESDTMEVNKVYGHDMVKNFLRIKDGKGKVTNCKIENTGTYGIRVAGTVTVENIYAKNLGTHGIYTSPGEITVKNVEVVDATEYGLVNCGADVVATDITVTGAGTSAFINYDSTFDGEGDKGLLTLIDCTATDCKSNLIVRGGTNAVVKDSVFHTTTRTNVHVTEGEAELTNVKLLGATDTDCSVISIRKDSKATLNNVEIANGNRGISLAGKVTVNGGSIHDNKGELAGNAIRAEENAVYHLEGVKIYNNHNTSTTVAGGVSFMSKGSHGTIVNCDITNNSSIRTVGAIFAQEAELNIRGTVFKQNETTGAEGDGGAIVLDKTKSIIRECVFEGNKTGTSYDNVAGAIFNQTGSDLTIRDCDFINNISGRGGAIANTGTLVIKEGTIFVGNTCTEGGAGVYNGGTGVVTDTGSIYEKNTLTEVHAGAAIRNDGANAKYTLSDGTFISNASAGDAGAVYSNSPITITDCTFSKNSATRGAAVYYNQNESITITGCTFTDNIAHGLVEESESAARELTLIRKRHGGAIFISNGTITDCTFSSNHADEGRDIVVNSNSKNLILSGTNTFDKKGNHVYLVKNASNVQSSVTLAGKTIGMQILCSYEHTAVRVDKTFDKSSEVTLVVDAYQSDIPLIVAGTADETTFAEATKQMVAIIGGADDACNISANGELSMPCVVINGVEYSSLADAILAAADNDTLVIVRDFTVGKPIEINKTLTITSENGAVITRSASCVGEAGQSLFTVTAGTLTIEGAEGKEIIFDGNASTKKECIRAINVSSGAELDMKHAVISNFYTSNKFKEGGTAIYNSGVTRLENVELVNNQTGTSSAGGAIRNQANASLTMIDCVLTKSATNSSGGALYIADKANTALVNCAFIENTAGTEGGAIYFNGTSAFAMSNCSFVGNKAQKGGAMSVKRAEIAGASFEGNTAEDGNVVYLKDADSYITLQGAFEGLNVRYSANNIGIMVAAEITGNITVIPNYAEGLRVVAAADGVSKDILKAAIKQIVVADDAVTGYWNLSQSGFLAKEACAQLANGERYYTLQEALEDAAEGETITLLRDISLANVIEISKSVTLTSDKKVTISRHESLQGSAGESLITVNSGTLSIEGTQGNEIVIDGNASTQEECIRAIAVVNNAALHMEHAVISNFYTSNKFSEAGNAIYNAGTITLEHVDFIDNVTATQTAGGTIRNTSTAVVTMTDCKITGSKTGGSGGAFYANNGAVVTLTNCEFTNNTAGGEGGAIYFNGTSEFVIDNCTFKGNKATTNGGAIAAKVLYINGGVFEDNTAATGNGVFLKNADSYVNIAGEFAGLNIQYNAENVGVKIAGEITGDVALVPVYTEGIQILIAADGVTEDTFIAALANICVAADEATGEWKISKKGYLVKEPCAKIGNEEFYTLQDALEVAEENDTIVLLKDITLAEPIVIAKTLNFTSDKKITITRAESLNGDNVASVLDPAEKPSMITVTGGTVSFIGTEGNEIIIEGNASGNKTEGIRAIAVGKNATLHMEHAHIQNFYTKSNYGSAGNALYNAGTVTLENVDLINNVTDTQSAGGAIRNTSTATLTMTNCMIKGSKSKGDGGAFYANNGAKVTLNNCEFKDNSSGNRGGVIYFNGTSNFVVNNCTFSNNTAVTGSAIWAQQMTLNGAAFKEKATETTSEVVLKDASSYVTLSGAFEGLTVAYSATNVGVKIADTVSGDITLIPVYTEGTQIVGAADGLAEDVFKAALELIQVAANEESNEWGLSSKGYLVKEPCAKIGNEEFYTLQDALEVANENDTIVLLKDITLAEPIVIAKTLTFTSDKKITITRAESLNGDNVASVLDPAEKPSMITVTGGSVSFIGTEGNEIIIEGNASGNNTEGIRAIAVGKNATLHMEYALIQNFYTKSSYGNAGNALYNAGIVTFENVDLINNISDTQSAGGAIRNTSTATLTMTDCMIQGSKTNSNGGAFYANNGAIVTLNNCEFRDNVSTGEGGVIYFNGSSSFVINNCTFINNKAAKGGAMSVLSATINGAVFEGNTASTLGNDVYLRNASSSVTLAGSFDNLTVAYTGDNVGIKIADIVTGDVTIIPYSYTKNTQIVQKTGATLSDDTFALIAQTIVVTPNGEEIWFVDSDGCLKQAYAQLHATTKYYASLEEAISAANAREGADEIHILNDSTVSASITITSDITLKPKKAVTITGSMSGNLFKVNAGATLNILGTEANKVTLKGSNATRLIYNSGTANLEHLVLDTARGGLITYKGKTTATDISISNCIEQGIKIADGTSELTLTNATVNNVTNTGAVVCGVLIEAGTVELTNITVDTVNSDTTGSHGLSVTGGTVTIKDVTVKNVDGHKENYGVNVTGGTVTVIGDNGLIVEDTILGHGVYITGGAFAASKVTVKNAQRAGIYVANISVTITNVEEISSNTFANNTTWAHVAIKNATVTINGVSKTEAATTYYELSAFN